MLFLHTSPALIYNTPNPTFRHQHRQLLDITTVCLLLHTLTYCLCSPSLFSHTEATSTPVFYLSFFSCNCRAPYLTFLCPSSSLSILYLPHDVLDSPPTSHISHFCVRLSPTRTFSCNSPSDVDQGPAHFSLSF